MNDLFFGTPMFDSRILPFALSAEAYRLVLLAGAAIAPALLTIFLMRRYGRSEGEYRSFRATTHPDSSDRLVRGVVLAGAVFAAVFGLGVAAA